MKILLVQSLLGGTSCFAVYPLGLAYIGTAIHQQGHEVRIFDPNIVLDPMDRLIQELDFFQPDVVGVSLRNIDNQYRIDPYYFYTNFQLTVKTVRSWNKSIPLIAGGPGFSMFSRPIMEKNPEIDFGVYLEGEESFPELLDNLGNPEKVTGVYYRSAQKVIFTGERPPLDFTQLFYPRRDFHDITPYTVEPFSIGLQTKRGCPLKCVYCNYPYLNGKHLRIRSVQHIVDEIEYLVKDCGIQEITFADSVLNLPHEHSIGIFKEIIRRQLNISWNAYMQIKNITYDYVKFAMASGCKTMLFSPDAYSQSALNGMRKGITTAEINANMEFFCNTPEFNALNVGYCFFLSPVNETNLGLLKTLLFFLKWKLKRQNRISIIISWIRLEPFTRAYEIAIMEGSLPKEVDLLPPDANLLSKTFYIAPAVLYFDTVLFCTVKVMRKIVHGIKILLKKSM